MGRDLLTDAGGRGHVLDETRIEAVVDYARVRIVTIASIPAYPALSALVGKGAWSGFRRSVEEAMPGEMASGRLRAQLLDDFPPAVMGNGRALRAEGKRIGIARRETLPVDKCAGWAEGGTLVRGFSELGPPIRIGPHCPALADSGDPAAWHDFVLLRPHGTRRARRLDIWEEDGRGHGDCFFRDSHVDRAGLETVVHEWRLRIAFDPATRCFVSAAAEAGPLPYPECPASAGSAVRLIGSSIDGLRRTVHWDYAGTSTCTHLNDTFRALEDAGALFDRLATGA